MAVTLSVTLEPVECCVCHLTFAVPRDWNAERLQKRDSWSCPNGHRQHYTGETEEQKLRRQLRERTDQLQTARARATHAQDQADAAERSARAYRGHLTRLRRKVANGICPAPGCGRTFENVRQHLAGVHPEFLAQHADQLEGGAH